MNEERQPTIYAKLMEVANAEPKRQLREFIEKRTTALTGDLATELSEQLRKAYQAGVVDGFQQGVASEHCDYCKDGKVILHAGSLDADDGYCELRSCSVCSDGRRLGRSDVPIVSESSPGPAGPHPVPSG